MLNLASLSSNGNGEDPMTRHQLQCVGHYIGKCLMMRYGLYGALAFSGAALYWPEHRFNIVVALVFASVGTVGVLVNLLDDSGKFSG